MTSPSLNDPFNHSSRKCWAALALLLGVAGCSDLSTLMRDEIAIESEMLDRIMNVIDEAGAKRYNKSFEKVSRDRLEEINNKRSELVDGLEKAQRALWVEYDNMVKSYLKAPIDEDMIKMVYEMGNSANSEKATKLLKDQLKEEDEKNPKNPKWDALLKSDEKWNKSASVLPSGKMMTRYLREKMAIRIAKEREVNRFQAIISKLQDAENPGPIGELSKIEKVLQQKK